jgi:hypothetical protein
LAGISLAHLAAIYNKNYVYIIYYIIYIYITIYMCVYAWYLMWSVLDHLKSPCSTTVLMWLCSRIW